VKKCSQCGTYRTFAEFRSSPRYSDGYFSTCRPCGRRTARLYAQTHKPRIRKKRVRKRISDPVLLECVRAKNRKAYRDYRMRCSEERRLQRRLWTRLYMRRYRQGNVSVRLAHAMRLAVNRYLRGKLPTTQRAVLLLGCSITTLKVHLERGFKVGMSWENYGRRGWHVDHIRPLRSFNLTDPEQIQKAFHYQNLQPLWARENLQKGSKFLP